MTPKRDDLVRFFGPGANSAWLDAIERLTPVLWDHYKFDRLRWVHKMGQVAHESGALGLSNMRENMYFTTAKRVQEVYRYRLGVAIKKVNSGEEKEPRIAKGSTVAKLAQACVRNPTLLANIVYGDREGTPWMEGSRYVGRALTQITHRNNYRDICAEIQRQPGGEKCPNLVANPEALEDPEWGVRSAWADWAIKGLNRYADQDNVDLVSDALNTGNVKDNVKPHGLAERRRWTAKAKVIWPAVPTSEPEIAVSEAPAAKDDTLRRGSKGEAVVALQKRLRELGYHSGAEDGEFGLLTERSVKVFQSEHGLSIDGIAGPKTLEAMANSAPADLGPRETVTAEDLKKRGSRIVTLGERVRSFCRWLYSAMFGTVLAESTGLDVIEKATATAGRINGFVDQLGLPAGITSPKVWVIIALAVVGLMAFLVGQWSKSIVDARVQDAQSGAHLGK